MNIFSDWHFHDASKWYFWSKAFFWINMKMTMKKKFHNMSQGPQNPGFMQEKVQNGDFLKKAIVRIDFFCCFRFLWISQRSGTLNWKRLVFLLSKILYKKCVLPLLVITTPALLLFFFSFSRYRWKPSTLFLAPKVPQESTSLENCCQCNSSNYWRRSKKLTTMFVCFVCSDTI